MCSIIRVLLIDEKCVGIYDKISYINREQNGIIYIYIYIYIYISCTHV